MLSWKFPFHCFLIFGGEKGAKLEIILYSYKGKVIAWKWAPIIEEIFIRRVGYTEEATSQYFVCSLSCYVFAQIFQIFNFADIGGILKTYNDSLQLYGTPWN
jgi:hypothetical protein